MAKTARLEVRVSPEFKARVEAECERRGMKVATFVERAVEARLAPEESVIVRAQAGEFERPEKKAQPDLMAALEKSLTPVPGVGWCPKATCHRSGPLGVQCPDHPNMRFKAAS